MLQEIWGWQPALYLFLGGMGAGAFVAAAVLYLRDREHLAKPVCISMWAALASLAVGLLLLLSELVFPARGLMMWQSFSQFGSWMTLGAWGAFLAMAVFFASALLATPPIAARLSGKWAFYGTLRKVLAIIGICLGVFVAFYTGMLLFSVPGVPLWNTLLLPCLFTVSGLDTGVALVEIVVVAAAKASKEDVPEASRALMERAVVVLVVLELVVVAAFLAAMLSADPSTPAGAAALLSAEQLTSGILAPYFWGMVVAVGLVVPLVAAVLGLALGKRGKGLGAAMCVGAIGALIGGCELRFLILSDGLHADYVIDALSHLVS